MMTDAEEIGQYAVEIFRQVLPTQPFENIRWVARDLTGRDFGIDITVEIFFRREPTGRLLLFQIKGRNKEIVWSNDNTFSYPHEVTNLLYAEKFNIPFILCLVELPTKNIYWLWMQRYIQLFLDRDKDWRNQNNKSLIFSKERLFSTSIDELSFISGHPQRISNIVVLLGAIKESKTRLLSFSQFLYFHLNENHPIENCQEQFPLLKYYLGQVINNSIWKEQDFRLAQWQLTQSINPIKKCIESLEQYLDKGVFSDNDNVGEYLTKQIILLTNYLAMIEIQFSSLNDTRLQRDMADYCKAKST